MSLLAVARAFQAGDRIAALKRLRLIVKCALH
jgi:hypothetical protein